LYGPPSIDDRWRVSESAAQQEALNDRLRRINPYRICFGLADGVLSSEERDMCDRFWAGPDRHGRLRK
jgi:hypothetical protein